MSLLILGLTLSVFKVGLCDINAGLLNITMFPIFLVKTHAKFFVKTLLLTQVFLNLYFMSV
jgi:hypothetical protein